VCFFNVEEKITWGHRYTTISCGIGNDFSRISRRGKLYSLRHGESDFLLFHSEDILLQGFATNALNIPVIASKVDSIHGNFFVYSSLLGRSDIQR
jgi:hypothetical protein